MPRHSGAGLAGTLGRGLGRGVVASRHRASGGAPAHCHWGPPAWGGGNRSGGRQEAVARATLPRSPGPSLCDVRAGRSRGWRGNRKGKRAPRLPMPRHRVPSVHRSLHSFARLVCRTCRGARAGSLTLHPLLTGMGGGAVVRLVVVQWCGVWAPRPGWRRWFYQ